MATYSIIKLKNLTPFHIGTGKENYDFSSSELHSDALSSALAAMRVQSGNANDVRGFMDSFVLSSAFPFVGGQYFLPKPQGRINVKVDGLEEHEYRKRLKKIRYIESSLWNRLVSGTELLIKKEQLKDAFLVADYDSFKKPFKNQVNQRVSVPRDGSDAEPFFFNWTYYEQEAGMYCMIDAEESVAKEVIRLFSMLGESGIGTDKNVGGGKFDVEFHADKIAIDSIADANASMLLSLYIPAEEELEMLNLKNSRYELLQRNGYMAGSVNENYKHLRKRTVYMFNVGSIFDTLCVLRGKIVDLRPDWNDGEMHPVYRSGKPFVVPVKLSNDE